MEGDLATWDQFPNDGGELPYRADRSIIPVFREKEGVAVVATIPADSTSVVTRAKSSGLASDGRVLVQVTTESPAIKWIGSMNLMALLGIVLMRMRALSAQHALGLTRGSTRSRSSLFCFQDQRVRFRSDHDDRHSLTR